MKIKRFYEFNNELSLTEKMIVDDILNENFSFNVVLDKIKSYAKKGLITTAVLTQLLGNQVFSADQMDQIEDAAGLEVNYGEVPSGSKYVEIEANAVSSSQEISKRKAISNAKIKAKQSAGKDVEIYNLTIIRYDFEEFEDDESNILYKCTVKVGFDIR